MKAASTLLASALICMVGGFEGYTHYQNAVGRAAGSLRDVIPSPASAIVPISIFGLGMVLLLAAGIAYIIGRSRRNAG